MDPALLARARPTTRGRSQRRCAASTSAPGVGSPLPPLRPCHICIGTGLGPATFAPGLCSPLAHLQRHLAHLSHICTGTGLIPATSAPGLGSSRPHPAPGLGSSRPHPAPGLGSSRPHLHRDWAHPCHICRYSMRAERCKVLRTYLRRNNRPRNNVTPKGHNHIRARCLQS